MINFVNVRSPFLMDEGVMPNLGLAYLVAVLKANGIPSQIADLGLGEEIPDGELFITGTTPQSEEILKLQRDDYTVIGGPHASVDSQELSRHFSLVVKGEGEQVIADIVKNKPTGVISTRRIRKLDELPFPDRSNALKYHWEIGGRKATTMITSRGCTGKCSFCCKAVMDKGIFFRSPQNILAEVEQIKDMGFGAVMFYDDSIAIIRKRLVEICKGLQDLDILWRCFVRSDQVDEDVFQRMADAGCYEVLVGVESGSNRILSNIRKHETAEQHKNAIHWAQKAGIKVKALMIAGLPGESWESIHESQEFIRETQPDSLDVTVLSVFKGCDIYDNPQKYDITFRDPLWYKGRNDEYVSTVHTSTMSESEIVSARNILWETFISL